MIDPSARDALYRRVADDLRQRIRSAAIPPGTSLPSEQDLMTAYAAGHTTIRNALRLLAAEGLISTLSGRPALVRHTVEVSTVHVDLVTHGVRWRPATEADAAALGVSAGAPVFYLVETLGGGDDVKYPTDAGGPWDATTTELRHRDGAGATDS